MTNNLTEFLSGVKARLEKATPGPLVAYERGSHSAFREFEIRSRGGILFRSTSYNLMQQDAELLASAPTDLTKLVQVVEVMRDALDHCSFVHMPKKAVAGIDFPQHALEANCKHAAEALARADEICGEKEME